MGFVPGTTTQIEAFLTEQGALELMTNGIGNISYFAVSDDGSNYNTNEKLSYSQVFTLGGKLNINNRTLSVINNITLPSRIFVDNTSTVFKTFENDSKSIILEETIGNSYNNTFFSVYGYDVDRTNTSSYQLNWIKDLSLPYGSTDNSLWLATFDSNGYSDTSISDMNTDNFLVFNIDSSQLAYMDGKTIKFTIPYLSGTVDTYSTFINTNQSKSYYDPLFNESSNYLSRFGKNVVLLFSDNVQRPNGDATKSWSIGYDFINSQFIQGGKNLANFVSSPGLNKDVAVGIAYLDKGVIVIFNSYLYKGYVSRSNDDISLNNRNVVKRTVSNFVCDLPIGKFYRSQNSTFSSGTPIRISSVGLYKSDGTLMGVGRFNTQIEKNSGERLTFLVKLVI